MGRDLKYAYRQSTGHWTGGHIGAWNALVLTGRQSYTWYHRKQGPWAAYIMSDLASGMARDKIELSI